MKYQIARCAWYLAKSKEKMAMNEPIEEQIRNDTKSYRKEPYQYYSSKQSPKPHTFPITWPPKSSQRASFPKPREKEIEIESCKTECPQRLLEM